ncbi:MAG: hypothetical protein ACR2JV_02450 [Gaiellales bacterium]
MSGRDRRADAARLLLLVLGLTACALLAALVFVAAGRPPRQAASAGCGLAGLALAIAGLVLLGAARRRTGSITQGTGLGALALSVPLLIAALVV